MRRIVRRHRPAPISTTWFVIMAGRVIRGTVTLRDFSYSNTYKVGASTTEQTLYATVQTDAAAEADCEAPGEKLLVLFYRATPNATGSEPPSRRT